MLYSYAHPSPTPTRFFIPEGKQRNEKKKKDLLFAEKALEESIRRLLLLHDPLHFLIWFFGGVPGEINESIYTTPSLFRNPPRSTVLSNCFLRAINLRAPTLRNPFLTIVTIDFWHNPSALIRSLCPSCSPRVTKEKKWKGKPWDARDLDAY